jgi:hypothetical protein
MHEAVLIPCDDIDIASKVFPGIESIVWHVLLQLSKFRIVKIDFMEEQRVVSSCFASRQPKGRCAAVKTTTSKEQPELPTQPQTCSAVSH